ncbi:MAG: branched-chain amino acid ABC transporter permease [Rhodospirillales bacterium]|nr:MAG: branched-chain amino acid ABC transporter permease [Rhodospirillales bacterium]
MTFNAFLLNAFYGLALAMNMFVIAAGLNLIFGVLRVINFAHGMFYMFGAYIVFTVTKSWGMPFIVGVAASGLGLAVIALFIERFLLRRLYDKEHLMQLLFTFAIVLLMSDAAKMIWGTDQYSVGYPPALAGAARLGPVVVPQYLVFLCVVGPLLAVAMWLAVDRTRWGRIVRAATQDREMLSALGVNVPLVYAIVFTIGSALAGIGGALAAPRIALVPGMDATIINECFIIVIIGGLGHMWGSFLGALAFGFVVQFGTVFVPNWQDVLPYLLMLVVLLIRPWGLLGRPELSR